MKCYLYVGETRARSQFFFFRVRHNAERRQRNLFLIKIKSSRKDEYLYIYYAFFQNFSEISYKFKHFYSERRPALDKVLKINRLSILICVTSRRHFHFIKFFLLKISTHLSSGKKGLIVEYNIAYNQPLRISQMQLHICALVGKKNIMAFRPRFLENVRQIRNIHGRVSFTLFEMEFCNYDIIIGVGPPHHLKFYSIVLVFSVLFPSLYSHDDLGIILLFFFFRLVRQATIEINLNLSPGFTFTCHLRTCTVTKVGGA